MFKPRHAYKSSITNRYRGKARGCPVFNNLNDIDSLMVEQHDECLQCLSKIKNRSELYRALADNNKPSNNVIKSLQKLSSSASNNSLKTCLQFLIIKVNERSSSKATTSTSISPTPTPITTSTPTPTPTATSSTTTIIEEPATTSTTMATSTTSTPTPESTQVSSSVEITVAIPARVTSTTKTSSTTTSSTTSWLSSYNSPPSPMSTASIASNSSHDSAGSMSTSSSSCSYLSPSPSPSPISSTEPLSELRRPRLNISDHKIRKIKKRPISFDDNYYSSEHSFVSTPTTRSGCSPGQHSNTTQNSDQSRLALSTNGSSISNGSDIHMFQAPAKFVNNLKPCNLPTDPHEPTPKPTKTPPVSNKEMLSCAICGIRDRPPNISKIFGQNSCLLCNSFFASFLRHPQQLYCAQDGDCLMIFDSRCQACWIKICLQKFDIDDEHRKIGHKYSPKLLSSPKVSLITIDTSLSR